MSNNLFQISLDEDETSENEGQTVGRLTDMDTREVSIVDRAANKRKFLMVKRNDEENTSMTTTATTDDKTTVTTEVQAEETAKTETTEVVEEVVAPEVTKGVVAAVLDDASVRVDGLVEAIKSAPVAKADEAVEAPVALGREMRAVQFMLKGLAGVTCKSAGLLIPVSSDLSEMTAITKAFKTSSLKVLREVAKRIETMKGTLATVEVLDASQARSIDATADLIAKAAPTMDRAVILARSLRGDQRVMVLSAIEKSIGGMVDIFVALQTDSITKGADIADQFEVGALLHHNAAEVEKAIAAMLTGTDGEVDLIDAAVEELRAIQGVEKTFDVKPMKGQFAVVEGKEVKALLATPQQAQAMAARLNAKAAKSKTTKMEELMKVLTPETEVATEETETEKVGRAMRGDRLNRLKSAVSMLKEALGDLRSGNISMEKLKQVGDVLGALINELAVAKRAAAAATGGVADKRSTDPSAPNAGSGVQPDTGAVGDMSDVMGEGTQGTAELLKQVDAKVAEVTKAKDGEIAKLRGELQSIRKARSAPSAPPSDGEIATEEVDTAKNDKTYWPSDMSDWDGKEDLDS